MTCSYTLAFDLGCWIKLNAQVYEVLLLRYLKFSYSGKLCTCSGVLKLNDFYVQYNKNYLQGN